VGTSEKTRKLEVQDGPCPCSSVNQAEKEVGVVKAHEVVPVQLSPERIQSDGLFGVSTGFDVGFPSSRVTLTSQTSLLPLRFTVKSHCGSTGPTGPDSQVLPVPPGPVNVASKTVEASLEQATFPVQTFLFTDQELGEIGVTVGFPVTGSAEAWILSSQLWPSLDLFARIEQEGAA
jgi:hypothetical protein